MTRFLFNPPQMWRSVAEYDWRSVGEDPWYIYVLILTRQAAEAVIDHFTLCDIFGDKGFIGLDWQTQIFDQTGNRIWTPRRSNQKTQNSPTLNRFLSSKRERIEGVFHEIQDVGRNIERLLTKTILGLATRVIAKMTSHVLRRLLLVDFGVNVQTFAVSSPA